MQITHFQSNHIGKFNEQQVIELQSTQITAKNKKHGGQEVNIKLITNFKNILLLICCHQETTFCNDVLFGLYTLYYIPAVITSLGC